MFLTFRGCCTSPLVYGDWQGSYNANEYVAPPLDIDQQIANFWNTQRTWSIVIIVCVGVLFIGILVLSISWRYIHCNCCKKEDEDWIALEKRKNKEKQLAKDNKDKDAFRTATKEKLNECLSNPVDEKVTAPTVEKVTIEVEPQENVQPQVSLDNEIDEMVPRTPIETPLITPAGTLRRDNPDAQIIEDLLSDLNNIVIE